MVTRRPGRLTTGALLLAVLLLPRPLLALDEPDRLWLVGERAYADKLYPVASRALERLVADHPQHTHAAEAVLLLGHTRLALEQLEPALQAFRRARTLNPVPGRPLEARFWEGETLFRLKRYTEAAAAFDEIVRTDAASPFAPDALYGFAWCELEEKRPERAVTALKEFLGAWPDHALAGSAAYYLARALVDTNRTADAIPLLSGYAARYPTSRSLADARYLLGWARLSTGDTAGAVRDLRAFAAAHPTHERAPEARMLAARAVAKQGGDREEMLESYKLLMEAQPPTAEALHDAAALAARLERPRERDTAWQKLRATFPDHPLTRRFALDMATASFKSQNWKDAASLAQIAAHSDEDTVRAEGWLLAGEAELKLRRLPAAARAFESVGEIANVDGGVRYRALAGLGLVREEQREWKGALAAYESVAAQSPDETLRGWAKQRVAAVKAQLEAGKPKPGSGTGDPARKPAPGGPPKNAAPSAPAKKPAAKPGNPS
jgi:TolA-binding protein